MMNKRYKKRLFAAWIVCCGLCSLMSCTLDESPRDQIPEEAAYQTATSLFQNTVATLYTYIGGSEDFLERRARPPQECVALSV